MAKWLLKRGSLNRRKCSKRVQIGPVASYLAKKVKHDRSSIKPESGSLVNIFKYLKPHKPYIELKCTNT